MVVMLAAPDDRDALAHAGRDLLREEPQGFVVERRALLHEKEVDAEVRVRHEPLRHVPRRARDDHRAPARPGEAASSAWRGPIAAT
jgi:hypothetical protein